MEYAALKTHIPRMPLRAANLTRAPALRLVPAARPGLLWEAPALSADYGAKGILRVSSRVAALGRYANLFGVAYGLALAVDRLFNLPPSFERHPGGRTIPGFRNLGAFDAVYGGTQTATFGPGDMARGKQLAELSGTWPFTVPGTSTSNDQLGFTYGPSLTPEPLGGMQISSAPGAGDTKVLERLWFGVIDTLLYSYWSSRNNLWERVEPSVVPKIVELPDQWRLRPPLGQPLPEPLAEPAYPLTFPTPRPVRRLAYKRFRKTDLMKISSIELDFRTRSITARKGKERKPPPGMREGKLRGKPGIAALIYQTWDAAQDWTDWLNIVSRNTPDIPYVVRSGSPLRQLQWWRNNLDKLAETNWQGVAWGFVQWRIDESIGAL